MITTNDILETNHQCTMQKGILSFKQFTPKIKKKKNAMLTHLSLGWYDRRLCNISPHDFQHVVKIEALINHVHSKKKGLI